jgi:hypothetical protein
MTRPLSEREAILRGLKRMNILEVFPKAMRARMPDGEALQQCSSSSLWFKRPSPHNNPRNQRSADQPAFPTSRRRGRPFGASAME